MPATLTPEEQQKVDAWINAVRALARQHGVAHRPGVTYAVKSARRLLVTEPLTQMIYLSSRNAQSAGIPEEELLAIRTLIFN